MCVAVARLFAADFAGADRFAGFFAVELFVVDLFAAAVFVGLFAAELFVADFFPAAFAVGLFAVALLLAGTSIPLSRCVPSGGRIIVSSALGSIAPLRLRYRPRTYPSRWHNSVGHKAAREPGKKAAHWLASGRAGSEGWPHQ